MTKQREPNPLWTALAEGRTHAGRNLLEISEQTPTLIVFLRHLGCTFCRETLADIASRREFLKSKGIQPVFVHMSEETEATQSLFRKYGVVEIPRVSDPEKMLYRAFGLERGKFRQVMGLRAILRGAIAAIFKGHWFGGIEGDPYQMPGVFLIHRGRILKDFRHEFSSDRPAYDSFGDCEGCS